jgi:uncharacterized protein (DUF608 family)
MSKIYTGEYTEHIAFPLGGIGAGMFCIEGRGAISHMSVRNHPDVFNEPCSFAAIHVKGNKSVSRVLEGQVPMWKVYGSREAGNGLAGKTYGLPRFRHSSFKSSFPFASVQLRDPDVPLIASITGWSPFTPGDSDSSSLPVAGLEYTFENQTKKTIEAVFSFNTRNFMAIGEKGSSVKKIGSGFILSQRPNPKAQWDEGSFCVVVDRRDAVVNYAWFRGGWFDPLTMAWNAVEKGDLVAGDEIKTGEPSPGASIYVPITLKPGEKTTIRLLTSWHVPLTDMNIGPEPKEGETRKVYRPWYTAKFKNVREVASHFKANYNALRKASETFSDCFFDSTLPSEVVESVESNLAIIKSPTILRQTDGRLWCWEGCFDGCGCCSGSCTHVWNYAQALPHLFPDLERTLRETEYVESQDERGHQGFRASLPIREVGHTFHAASDGQLGGIMKLYRDWRISGDTAWLKAKWPLVKKSIDYGITTWDPDGKGVLCEPHHNTYDIEFWGPDGMCTSFYHGALRAVVLMGEKLGVDVTTYKKLLEKGLKFMDEKLWNGEYYIQSMDWTGLRAGDPRDAKTHGENEPPEAIELFKKEGPKYQYGNGCITDGVLGYWMAEVCGLQPFANDRNVTSHLKSIHKYNLKTDLTAHANPQRPTYAVGNEGGLLLCTWPHGDKLSLPFVYSDEVWTGIEHQAASHMMLHGLVSEGCDVIRELRKRYDGKKRNPYDEYECGHWYARAMASYAYLQAMTGARYDAVDKKLYLEPRIGGDFRSFLCTASGFGTVGVKDGKPFIEVAQGTIEVKGIEYKPV